MNRDAATQFLERVHESNAPWKSVDLRTVAVRVGRHWTQLATRAYLDHRRPVDLDRLDVVERRNLKAWQLVLPVAKLPAVVNGFVDGCLRLRPRYLWVSTNSDGERHDLTYYFSDLIDAHPLRGYPYWAAHTLVGYGPPMWDLSQAAGINPNELSNVIRAGPNAYDGFPGLTRFFLRCTQPLTPDMSSSVFEVIAPLAVRFDMERTRVLSNELTLGLRSSTRSYAESAWVHWTVIGSGPLPRHSSVNVGDSTWIGVGDAQQSSVSVPLESGDIQVSAFLQADGRALDRVTVQVPHTGGNRRLLSHATSDPGLERFHSALFPTEWRRSSEFEQAVGLLLHFLGFQLDPLASLKGANAALDHVAHDPFSMAVLGIECTVGALESAKSGKLVARVEAIRRALPDSDVLPVLACARPRSELLSTELERCANDGIVVLAREDLESVWTLVQHGGSTADFVAELRNRLAEESRRLMFGERINSGGLGLQQ